ncbi:ATP-binding protein [Reichenbachiella versicolor]|uniref:ATP-binding protein n=1 Tax=Reichenbachiella versicolor TaxID=1821036 RepID=UPI000D6E958D|nr:ATP-binding protein [Reichenbachiella versicolor]
MAEQNSLHFKTNVQLKSIIGKDLINDDNIAILELVKNSFDADAKQVFVKYLNLKTQNDLSAKISNSTSRIIIQDDGIGMNLDDIKDKWLNIAFSQKKSNTKQHNRRMAGAKGVGRFSCDRLGEFLNLYAKKADENKYVKLFIDWKQFEIEDEKKEIQAVNLKYEELTHEQFKKTGLETFDHGVLLEIIKLRSSWVYPVKDKNGKIEKWNSDKLVELKKYLEKLINPNQAFENDDFGIFIDAPEFIEENNSKEKFERFIGKVENRIFEKLDFKTTSIESKIIDGGGIILTTLKDKGETIFWVKEENEYSDSLKDITLNLYYLNPYAKAFFTRQTGVRSVDYGSVYLFLNGFRIPPYGEPENDWLKLDQRKAQGYARFFGTRDVVGTIEINDNIGLFPIVTSRTGLVQNNSYQSLTEKDGFFFKQFKRLEKYVVDGLDWDRIPKNIDFQLIESKIKSGESKDEDLIFEEDENSKQERIYSTIHSIISAKSKDVIELYINEHLITRKIEEERQNSEKEFSQLLEDFGKKKIDSDTLSRILEKKAEENKSLQKQLNEFSKYTTNEITSKALLELQDYKETIEKQSQIILDLQQELTDLKEKKELAENSVKSIKQQVKTYQKDLSLEKQKNQYLLATRKTLSSDADGLIHTIKINNIEVRDGLENIIEDLTEGSFEVQNLIERLGFLKLNAERSLKMAEFATRANLSEDIEKKDVDVVSYIKEYIDLYGKTFSDKVDFQFELNNATLNKNISVLNLSIILDNLISNSIKWNAKNILLTFHNISEKQLDLVFSDDGLGLSNDLLDNPNCIFELSIRNIPPSQESGSGIGLFYTKDLLNEMNSDITFLGNKINYSGASFKLTFETI